MSVWPQVGHEKTGVSVTIIGPFTACMNLMFSGGSKHLQDYDKLWFYSKTKDILQKWKNIFFSKI